MKASAVLEGTISLRYIPIDYRLSPWIARLPRIRKGSFSPRVKDDGWFGNSYQNLSPRREWPNCVAIRQAKVGPSILPGSGLSDTPPDHKSTSAGCLKRSAVEIKPLLLNTLYLESPCDRSTNWLWVMRCKTWSIDLPEGFRLWRSLQTCYTHSKIVLYRLTVSFGMEPNNSSKVFASGRPQYFLEFYNITYIKKYIYYSSAINNLLFICTWIICLLLSIIYDRFSFKISSLTHLLVLAYFIFLFFSKLHFKTLFNNIFQ